MAAREFVHVIGPDGKSIRNDLYNSPPNEASYIIFKKGDLICAKNGETGQIEFSGTDAATVIQNAINQLTSGGKIFIKEGQYYINTPIELENNIMIVGAGRGTILASTNVINIIECIGSSSNMKYGVVVRDLVLRGYNVAKRGIYFEYVVRSRISAVEGVVAANFITAGIELVDCYGIRVLAEIIGCSQYGLYAARCHGGKFKIYLYACEWGAQFYNCAGVDITGICESSGQVWVRDDGTFASNKVTIHDMYFENNTIDIRISSNVAPTKSVTVKDCYFMSNPDYHILISGNVDGVHIRRNLFKDAQSYVICVLGADVKNVFVEENYYDTTTPFIYDESDAVSLYKNINYPTENDGVAVIPSGSTSVTVNHGLAGAPTQIYLTGTHSEVKDAYVQNITATSFDVVVDNPVSADRIVYWRAIYRP